MTVIEGAPVQDPSIPAQDTGLIFAPPPDVDHLPVLVRYRNGVDVLRRPAPGKSWDDDTLKGFGYEDNIFSKIATRNDLRTEDGQSLYVFGPGAIEAALTSLGHTPHPEEKSTPPIQAPPDGLHHQFFGLPDAVGVTIAPPNSRRRHTVLKVRRLYEARLGRARPHRKLEGFAVLTQRLRENPDHFSTHMADVMAGANHLVRLIVPRDSEIVVEFITPRGYETDVLRSPDLPFPFKYSSIPLSSSAAQLLEF